VTIYRIPTPCQTCEHVQCRCAQDEAFHHLVCSRCETASDNFDSPDECDDTLDREGWQVGGTEFCDICPSCMYDLNERDRRGRSVFAR
jgi:hypothetical protein